ncbi:hypothetical protein [Schumannella soli]|uniref:Uncharacterized protein n=1 Tax=Schumannella soli TaxID=2590779 RepID=A0A506XXU6_9MICO|nr:hypothetical protein [Schumannella soli]TPW77591.1 hypothetical protein FJ657_02660 [Schumannella soli]
MSGPQQRLSRRERWIVAASVAVFVVIALAISTLPRSTPPWLYMALIGAALLLIVLGVLISRRR